MQRQQASSGGTDLRHRILSSFWSDHIEPVPVPAHYRLGLLIVAVGMVMLPLAYAVMIVAVLYGLYAYVAYGLDSGSFGNLMAWPLHLAVGFVGLVLVAFMIKPFFSGSYQQFKPRPIRKDQEPVLFAFIERLCAMMDVPFPKRIYVTCKANASAGFRRGMSSFFSHDLELMLGLPLVAGLELQQLAGVLAHELGHFAQGTAMRLTYVIRSVSYWFARVVYERDAWDVWLYRQTADPGVPLWVVVPIRLCQMMITLVRGILWLFMWISHGLASALMRQMEYDADRRQVRLVGAETFETCMWELIVLNVGHQKSLADLEESLREGRLADDLPGLVVVNRRDLPVHVIDPLRSQLASEKTSLFATHPAARDRVANARGELARPAFSSDLPAPALFRDFAALSKRVSLDFYRAVLGPRVTPEDLFPLTGVVERRDRTSNERDVLNRYFRDTVTALRPLVLDTRPLTDVKGTEALVAAARAAHQQVAEALPQMLRDGTDYQETFDKLLELQKAQAMTTAGFQLKGADSAAIQHLENQAREQLDDLDERLKSGEQAVGKRLTTALYLMKSELVSFRVDGVDEFRREAPALLRNTQLMTSVHPLLTELLGIRSEVGVLGAQLREAEPPDGLRWALEAALDRLRGQLAEICRKLEGAPYPFDHADAETTLQSYVVPEMPEHLDLGLYDLGGYALDHAYEIYFRLVGRLAFIAEQLEQAAGLEPLPRVRAAEPPPADGARGF